MALENYCASCRELSENLDCGQYYCFMKGKDVYASDPKCNYWGEAYSRSDTARENMYSNSRSSQSGGGCYITTAMCKILNYEDDNYYLQMLRTFRDETLKKDMKYLTTLLTYDIIGPQIAYHLYQDPYNKNISNTLVTNYIKKAVEAIEKNKTEEAIQIYMGMTHLLVKRYNLDLQTIDTTKININEININNLGHGRTRIKRLETI